MKDTKYLISVRADNAKESSLYAVELKDYLEGAAPGVSVERRRDRDDTQDLGTTLVLLLATPAVVAVVRALNAFLQKRQSATLIIKTEREEVLLKDVTSQTALDALREVLRDRTDGLPK